MKYSGLQRQAGDYYCMTKTNLASSNNSLPASETDYKRHVAWPFQDKTLAAMCK